MRNGARKFLILIAVIVTAIVCFAFSASAETQGYYTYNVTDGEATITHVDTSISGEVVIPDTLGGYPVTAIGDKAFFGIAGITKVTIPDSVTSSIGKDAFYGCDNLHNVIIGNNVTGIGESAFCLCRTLYSVTIGNKVAFIGEHAFSSCGFSGIIIPNSVEIIEESAFYSCTNLSDVTIPNSVKTIESGAFMYCSKLGDIVLPDSLTSLAGSAFSQSGITGLTIGKGLKELTQSWSFNDYTNLQSIQVDKDNLYFSSKDGVLFNKSKTEILCYPRCKIGSYVIPSSVINIADAAFEYCDNLTEIIIPDSVETIGAGAFWRCYNLERIILGTGLKSVGRSAFDYCYGISDVHFCGTQEQWNKLEIEVLNNVLLIDQVHLSSDSNSDGYCDECGYFVAHSHSYTSQITKIPTCEEKGEYTYYCSCGDSYTKEIANTGHSDSNEDGKCDNCGHSVAHSHSYTSQITIIPTCEDKGEYTYYCSCGDSYTEEIANTGHSDNNEDGICDNCDMKLSADTVDCRCKCHRGGFIGFIWKILRFFYRIFGINKICACGAAHY